MTSSSMPSTPIGAGTNRNNNDMDFMPLYMSLIAGMSTTLGAAFVLLQRRTPKKGRQHRSSPPPVIPPSTMSFSLALAGSVMVTVSVVSIIPECLREDAAAGGTGGYRMIPLWSTTFLYRVLFHAIGYILYFLLAKFAFPEPDEILGLTPKRNTSQVIVDSTTATASSSSIVAQSTTTTGGSSNDLEEFRAFNGESMAGDDQQSSQNGKQISSSTSPKATRNRRAEKGIPSAGSFDTAVDNGNDTATNNNNNSNTSIENDKEKPDFFRSFSRYSSGADLESQESKRAWRVAMLLFLSLTVHNFPEGLAVAASAMESRELGLKVTIGIMVHNIPEGISIAVPCLAARPDSPWLAFWLSALSGLAEPLGAFVALFALRNIDGDDSSSTIFNMENVLAFVAGIMIMVAVAELFPEALRHTKEGKFHFVAGTVCGVVLMLATELYLA